MTLELSVLLILPFALLAAGLALHWSMMPKKRWRLSNGELGLDWGAMKVDECGQEYFDLGDVHLYPWANDPVMDVIDAKTGLLVEENINHRHPKYGRELYKRYLLPGRYNNFFQDNAAQKDAP